MQAQHIAASILGQLSQLQEWRAISNVGLVCHEWKVAAEQYLDAARYQVCAVEAALELAELREQKAAMIRRSRELQERLLDYMESCQLYHLEFEKPRRIILERRRDSEGPLLAEVRRLVRGMHGMACWHRVIAAVPTTGSLPEAIAQQIGGEEAKSLMALAEEHAEASRARGRLSVCTPPIASGMKLRTRLP